VAEAVAAQHRVFQLFCLPHSLISTKENQKRGALTSIIFLKISS